MLHSAGPCFYPAVPTTHNLAYIWLYQCNIRLGQYYIWPGQCYIQLGQWFIWLGQCNIWLGQCYIWHSQCNIWLGQWLIWLSHLKLAGAMLHPVRPLLHQVGPMLLLARPILHLAESKSHFAGSKLHWLSQSYIWLGQSYIWLVQSYIWLGACSIKVLIVKVALNDSLDLYSPKIDQVDNKINMWGSPTCSRRSLSVNINFQKESSWVPRMMPLIHPAKNFDLLVLHIPVLSLIEPS